MADVFLSYARMDRALAEKVKAGLDAAGLSVFFDVEGLDGGDVFPDVLDREVKGAGAVVSLWSQHSLSRPWVKQECSIGLKRKCLIPLAIERLGELDVPVAFEGLQQIDFTGFHGRTDGAEWQKLMRALARTLGRPDLAEAAAAAPARAAAAAPARKGPWPAWPKLVAGMAGAAAVIAVVGFGYRMLAPDEAATQAAEMAEVPATGVPEVGAEPDAAQAEAPAAPSQGATFADDGCGDAVALVYFDFDKTNLTPEAISVLEGALRRSFGCQLLEVRIEAHDDLLNSPSYAEGVSQRRADTVAQWLTAQGVEEMRITRIGYGSSQPLAPGVKSPFNRRADVVFDYEAPAPAE
ncbi:TIR domain-containing protein [Hyphomonas sp.]|uniref:TIR domain-containing protein n=1 Tax=Hyphomonas sp. TaxID=87 RepID=UPI0025B9B264|nr:TIR domain-containing protein [Hyphomonas sp.]